jgi:siroheme synthase-like protein
MKYMPLFFDLQERRILVIGGGKVALRKSQQLDQAGASLTIIAPQILDEFRQLANVCLIERKAAIEDIKPDFFLVFIASSDQQANSRIADECRQQKVLFCRCDDFKKGDFITGNTLSRGEIICSTISGGVPEVSRFIKNRINDLISPELEQLAGILAELRPTIKKSAQSNASLGRLYSKWLNETTLRHIKTHGIAAVREEIIRCL